MSDFLRAALFVPSASTGMALLVTLTITGPLFAWWLASCRPAAAALTVFALLPILALTLTPTQREVQAGCAVDLSPQLTAAEPLWNVLLFVPFGLGLTVTWRRPLAAAVTGSLTSFSVELVQAAATPLGRSCDTSDLIANTVGTIAGAILAAIGMALERLRRPDETRDSTNESAGARARPPGSQTNDRMTEALPPTVRSTW